MIFYPKAVPQYQNSRRRGGESETKLIPITPKTKVCTKQTIADGINNELHALFHTQTSFQACQIVNALSEWRTITSDPTTLEFC